MLSTANDTSRGLRAASASHGFTCRRTSVACVGATRIQLSKRRRKSFRCRAATHPTSDQDRGEHWLPSSADHAGPAAAGGLCRRTSQWSRACDCSVRVAGRLVRLATGMAVNTPGDMTYNEPARRPAWATECKMGLGPFVADTGSPCGIERRVVGSRVATTRWRDRPRRDARPSATSRLNVELWPRSPDHANPAHW